MASDILMIGLVIAAIVAILYISARRSQKAKAKVIERGLEAMQRLNKELLEKTGHKLEAVKQPGGELKFVYKQIWSAEEIQRKEKEDAEAVIHTVGNNLLEDRSPEAARLLAFLEVIYEANMGKHFETPKDLGLIWFACMEAESEDPDSEVSQKFKVLNDAWAASRSDK